MNLPESICTITYNVRQTSGSDREESYALVGSIKDVSAAIAQTVEYALSHSARQITITPISRWAMMDAAEHDR